MNEIICGDSFEELKKLPDNSVDLTVTSPPYDTLRTYGGYEFKFQPTAHELYRVTKLGGVVVWVVGDATVDGSETGSSFKQALGFMDVGFNLHDTMIYIKRGGLNSGSLLAYQQKFEYMFVFSKGRPKTINLIRDRANVHTEPRTKLKRQADGSYKKQEVTIAPLGVRYNVWEYMTGKAHSTKDAIAFEHPAIFPEKLAADHIKSWSNEGDLVLDPMCGSGTTLKMAKSLSRRYLGIEVNSEYVEIANARLKEVQPVLL